jgi:hypothetical protein
MKKLIFICLIIILIFLILYNTYPLKSNQEGMTQYTSKPAVLSNSLIESGKDATGQSFLDTQTYMEDTQGNFLTSNYNSVIHSMSNAFKSAMAPQSSQDCQLYQTFTQTPDRTNTCASICPNPNQYYDITHQTCNYCPIGYGNDGANNCVPLETCPYGYRYTDHSGNCLPCPVGKKYDDNSNCVNICLDYETYQADGTCALKCPQRNQYYDTSTQACISCPGGYLEDGHNHCVPAPTCPPGQMHDSSLNCTTQCSPFTYYDLGSNSCVHRCPNSQVYDVNSQQCKDCLDGFIGDGNNNCVAKPPAQTPSCDIGYRYDFTQAKCVSICPVGFKNNLFNTLQCDPMCIGHSVFSSTSQTCVQCPDTQINDGSNNCIPMPTPTPTPLVCKPGYQIATDSTTGKETCHSICPPDKINNKLNPLICQSICESPNDIYDTQTLQCYPCDSKSTPDSTRNKCISAPATTGTQVNVLNMTEDLPSQYVAANWVWNVPYADIGAVPNQPIWFLKNFIYKGTATTGYAFAVLNGEGSVFLNNVEVGAIGDGASAVIPIQLNYGINTVAVAAYATGGPAGLILSMQDSTGVQVTQTDNTWTYVCTDTYQGTHQVSCTNNTPIIVNMTANVDSTTQITVSVYVIKSTTNSVIITDTTTGASSSSLTPSSNGTYTGVCSYAFTGLQPYTTYSFSATAYSP